MSSQYWLVSLPLVGTKEQTITRLNECSASVVFMSENSKFEMPDLRVGTGIACIAQAAFEGRSSNCNDGPGAREVPKETWEPALVQSNL